MATESYFKSTRRAACILAEELAENGLITSIEVVEVDSQTVFEVIAFDDYRHSREARHEHV